MSKRDVAAFLDRLTAEDDFRADVGRSLEGRSDTATATVEIARGAGFEFDEQEFDAALEERYADRELSDDELGQASGGRLRAGAAVRRVHRTASGMQIVFPDVCKTPAPGGPVPIPYPNVGGP